MDDRSNASETEINSVSQDISGQDICTSKYPEHSLSFRKWIHEVLVKRMVSSIYQVSHLLLIVAALSSCSDSEQVVVLKNALVLPAKQTVEIRAPIPLLTPARSQTASVCITVSAPLHTEGSPDYMIVTSEGRRIFPKVFAVRKNGQVDELIWRSSLLSNVLCFDGPDINARLHPPYVAVRIESPESIQVGRITWESVNK